MDAKKLILAVFGTIFRVAVTVFVIFFIYSAACYSYDYGYRIFTEPAVALGEGREVTVTVTGDMSPLKVGELFEELGLVRDSRLFALQYLLSEYRKEVQPGTFVLNTNMEAEDMMAVMAAKEEIPTAKLEQPPVSETMDSTQTEPEDEEETEEW